MRAFALGKGTSLSSLGALLLLPLAACTGRTECGPGTEVVDGLCMAEGQTGTDTAPKTDQGDDVDGDGFASTESAGADCDGDDEDVRPSPKDGIWKTTWSSGTRGLRWRRFHDPASRIGESARSHMPRLLTVVATAAPVTARRSLGAPQVRGSPSPCPHLRGIDLDDVHTTKG